MARKNNSTDNMSPEEAKEKNKRKILNFNKAPIENNDNPQRENFRKDVNNINKNINSALFGGYTNTANMIDDTVTDSVKSLEMKLEEISSKYKDTTGSNPMEFFNRLEIEKNSSNDDSYNKGNYKVRNYNKKMEQILKNSNGEFFLEEKDRFFRYEDYRLIDAYIPEVSKCLDLYRDCILSPDDITKKSISYFYEDENLDDSENTDLKFLHSNIEILDKKYNLTKKFRNDIREGCELGDLFYLVMPYSKGFERVLHEDELFVNDSLDQTDQFGETLTESMMSLDSDEDFNLLMEDIKALSKNSKKGKEEEQTIERAKKDILDSINYNVKYFKDPTDILSEKKQEKNASRDFSDIELNGSIFKKLAPENVVVLELDDQVFGYIYIEKNNVNLSQSRGEQRNSNPNSLRSGNTGSTINTSDSLGYGSNDVFNSRYDYLNRDQSQIKSKYALISSIFVKGISKKINKDFIKRNKEFKELIYSLVHEEYITKKEVKMTFIEPQYMHHFKLASSTIYGVSKISKSLFFSKIYLSVLLTNLMQKVIRGRDKRAFYIETGLDDDIEGAVQGFIKDIKSKELSSGNFKNITSILNSVGAFEDYYIPLVDGEESVRIDTVQGMDVEIDNEFLQQLKKSIITGMNVPSTYIDASSEIDFARTLTMSNNPFVRAIINDQEEFGDFFTKVLQDLYRNEFAPEGSTKKKRRRKRKVDPGEDPVKTYKDEEKNVEISGISIRFPTPIYLVLGNMNEQITNAQNTTEFVTQLYFPEDPTGQQNTYDREVKKSRFRRKLLRKCFLPTLDWELYDEIFEEVSMDEIEDAINNGINFGPQAKELNDLDSLEEDDF